jgi:methenyltetrahydrofolate cyclohydrolase
MGEDVGSSVGVESSINDFISDLASSAPTPGGGAVSALAGALAAALAEMVGQLTTGREKYREVEPQVREILAQLAAQRAELMRLVEQDALAYQQVAAAYRLPRSTDQEREERATAVEVALNLAMEPPRLVAQAARSVLVLAGEIAAIGNPTVASDAGCAALLAQAALRCAGLNVLANVVLLRDRDAAVAARTEMAALEAESAPLLDLALATVRTRMRA